MKNQISLSTFLPLRPQQPSTNNLSSFPDNDKWKMHAYPTKVEVLMLSG